MNRRWLFLLPVLAFAGIAVFLGIGLTHDPSKLPSALLDKPVPRFELPGLDGADLDGEGLSSADLADGEPVLVNIFASWCVPCRVEHPYINALAEEGIRVVGINYKDKPENARAWLAGLGNPYTLIGSDRDGRAGIEWGVYGVPETFVIDGSGTIRYKHVGPVQERDLRNAIRPVLEEIGR